MRLLVYTLCVCARDPNSLTTKIGYNFEMKRTIKIRRHGFVGNPSDNNLAKFQPNWFRGC